MARYIDADALYEKIAEWEASALSYIEVLNRTPLEEMDEDEKAEWRRWTAILGERSAFKFDVADAPSVDVRENVRAHWDRVEMKKDEWWHTCSKCKATWGSEEGELDFNFCPNCGAEMEANDAKVH